MPKVHHVKKARRDNPRCDVKVGESYYWWSNRLPGRGAGVKRCSKTYPRRSQVLMGFASEVASLEEMIDDDTRDTTIAMDDAVSLRDGWVEAIRALADEQQEKYDNMGEYPSLQEGPTGQLLQERQECLEEWADELERIDPSDPSDDDPNMTDDEALMAAVEEFFNECTSVTCNC